MVPRNSLLEGDGGRNALDTIHGTPKFYGISKLSIRANQTTRTHELNNPVPVREVDSRFHGRGYVHHLAHRPVHRQVIHVDIRQIVLLHLLHDLE